jgi:hypothetical protein
VGPCNGTHRPHAGPKAKADGLHLPDIQQGKPESRAWHHQAAGMALGWAGVTTGVPGERLCRSWRYGIAAGGKVRFRTKSSFRNCRLKAGQGVVWPHGEHVVINMVIHVPINKPADRVRQNSAPVQAVANHNVSGAYLVQSGSPD